jgi:galactose mutarotase-like enzyme
MTPAKRTARACRTIAGISATSALVAATWHPYYAVPGLVGAAVLLLVAAAYQVDDTRQQARHEALILARLSDERLLPAPCCAFWEQPDGQHAAGCRNSRSAA